VPSRLQNRSVQFENQRLRYFGPPNSDEIALFYSSAVIDENVSQFRVSWVAHELLLCLIQGFDMVRRQAGESRLDENQPDPSPAIGFIAEIVSELDKASNQGYPDAI
jgi:hypothetical protein